MADLSRAIARVRAELEGQDASSDALGVPRSDWAEVPRADVEVLLAAAAQHEGCQSGWLRLGAGGLGRLGELLDSPGAGQGRGAS